VPNYKTFQGLSLIVKYRRLPDKKETKVIKRIEVEGVELDATSDLYNLVDTLIDADSPFEDVKIYNKDLASKLTKLNVVSQSSRGPYSAKNKPKLRELRKVLLDVVYGDK